MFEEFTWKRGSGELGVIDKFACLAKKASEEAGADVLIVLNFPSGPLHVVASTAENPVQRTPTWTARTVAKGLTLLHQWLRRIEGDEAQHAAIQGEIERIKSGGAKS